MTSFAVHQFHQAVADAGEESWSDRRGCSDREDLQLLDRVRVEIHFGACKGRMAQPERDLADVPGGMQDGSVAKMCWRFPGRWSGSAIPQNPC